VLLVQLAGTFAIIAFVPTGVVKAAAMVLLWAATFRRIDAAEAILFVTSCAGFSAMEIATQGPAFEFTRPDVLGLPAYEFMLWGYSLLHGLRFLGGPVPAGRRLTATALALGFIATFAVLESPSALLAAGAALCAIGVLLFHEREDLAYASYLAVVGTATEYVGLWSGEWRFADAPPTGVPLWYLPLWAGVGLLLRRWLLPWLAWLRRILPTPAPPSQAAGG